MNLTLFRQLYESTFKAEPLLAGFWSVAMYDLEEESFSSWATMREKLEENARNQRKMLKMLFDGLFPATIADTEKSTTFHRKLWLVCWPPIPGCWRETKKSCAVCLRNCPPAKRRTFGVNHGIKTYSWEKSTVWTVLFVFYAWRFSPSLRVAEWVRQRCGKKVRKSYKADTVFIAHSVYRLSCHVVRVCKYRLILNKVRRCRLHQKTVAWAVRKYLRP